MKMFSASYTINASPEIVWAILTDAAHYPKWEPNTIRIEGEIASSSQFRIYTKLSPERAFPVQVTTFAAPQKMVWTGACRWGCSKANAPSP